MFVPLAAIPALLQTAVVVAEDQHFYEHHGVDWPARVAALSLDIRERSAIRGASSITEQVVRMVHPRPRNCGHAGRGLRGCPPGRPGCQRRGS